MRAIETDTDQYSCQVQVRVQVVQESDWVLACRTGVDQAVRSWDQIAGAVHTAGARVEVGSGDIAAAVDAAVAAAHPSIEGRVQDIRWEEACCTGSAGPYGVALQDLQDLGRCAGHREHEGADHSR